MVGGVVTITSVLGGSVIGGSVAGGAVTAGVVTVDRTLSLVDVSTLVDVDEVAVAGLDPPPRVPVTSSTITSTMRAPPSRTDDARAQRGQPRNAQEPGGTTGGAAGVPAGTSIGRGRTPVGSSAGTGGSSTGMGTVGSSSSSVMVRRCHSYPWQVSPHARPRRFVRIWGVGCWCRAGAGNCVRRWGYATWGIFFGGSKPIGP